MSDDDLVDGAPAARPDTFAEKLTRALDVLCPEISTRKLAARVKELGGSVSASHISELKSGKKTNPSKNTMVDLAAAIGIPAGYFTDPEVAERVDRELDRLEQYKRNPKLAELAEQTVAVNMRTASLPDDERVEVAAMAELVQSFWNRRKRQRDA